MPRIRSVKPEFWDSPSTASASAVARLAYIAMWNWADDYGRGTANLKELEGFIFPNDDVAELSSGNTVNFRSVVAEVSACFDVVFYTVGGRPFYQVQSWEKHQRNERRSAQSKYPGPDQADPVKPPPTRKNDNSHCVSATEERKHRAPVAEPPNISVAGTGEQGNRGTGEQGKSATRGDEAASAANAQTLVAEWMDHQAKRPPGQVIGQIAKQIGGMLGEGIDYEDVRLGLQVWQTKGLNPSTLPSVVHEMRTAQPKTSKRQQETDDLFSRALRRNGEANPDVEQKVIGA